MNETNAFYAIILNFGQEVGRPDLFAQAFENAPEVLLVLAFLSCFFGFKLVRLFSAVMAFFLTATAICELLQSSADKGIIVTTFAVVGLIAGFIVYHWYKFSVFLLSVMMGYSLAAVLSANIWVCFSAAILCGALSLRFTPAVVILSTTIWGGCALGFGGIEYLGVELATYKIFATAALVIAGIFAQCAVSKIHCIPPKGLNYTRQAAQN